MNDQEIDEFMWRLQKSYPHIDRVAGTNNKEKFVSLDSVLKELERYQKKKANDYSEIVDVASKLILSKLLNKTETKESTECQEIKLEDLKGHTILDISDEVALLLKTDKGIYQIDFRLFPDESLAGCEVTKTDLNRWNTYNQNRH